MAERRIAMINNINEGTMRAAAKIGPSDIIQEKQFAQQQAEQVRQARPIENAASGAQTEKQNDREEGSGKYLVEDKKVVFEKYNAKGELVLRIPPSYKPVDERV
jgi:hypothetical protein